MDYYSETKKDALDSLEKMYQRAKDAIENGASIATASNDYPSKRELEIIIKLDYSDKPKSGYIN